MSNKGMDDLKTYDLWNFYNAKIMMLWNPNKLTDHGLANGWKDDWNLQRDLRTRVQSRFS